MKKELFQNETEFGAWRKKVEAYNHKHAYMPSPVAEPESYPAVVVYWTEQYTLDAHFDPVSKYEYMYVYPSDFQPKTLKGPRPSRWVGPSEFVELATFEADPTQWDMDDGDLFYQSMRRGEYKGFEAFREAMLLGQSPKRWRIRINGNFDELMIRSAVRRYIEAGWPKATYSYNDKTPGSYEPNGEWVIVLKLPERG